MYVGDMSDFIAFPPSPVINSGVYYRCGADFCEEGLQFCNIYDRRCEYCADHHHDCFTYVQQQNCTQYCQDQWKKNQPDVSGCQISQGEDVYKTLSIVFFTLWLISFIILLLQVACIRKVIWNSAKHFLPNQVVVFSENVLSKFTSVTSCTTDGRNRRPQGVDGTSIEDREAMHREVATVNEEQTTDIPSLRHDTGRKTVVSIEKLRNNQGPGSNTDENKKGSKPKISSDTRKSINGSVCADAKISPEFDILEVNDKDKLNERKGGIPQDKFPVMTEECRVRQSRTLAENVLQSYIPHGELPTMSSRGSYQAMLPSSNQSTDNGYATFIPNITLKETPEESKS